jgi:hypothetical protein
MVARGGCTVIFHLLTPLIAYATLPPLAAPVSLQAIADMEQEKPAFQLKRGR